MSDTDAKLYLGDGVYVEVWRGMVKLTTNNGIRDTNTIFLEPEVLQAFLAWVMRYDPKSR